MGERLRLLLSVVDLVNETHAMVVDATKQAELHYILPPNSRTLLPPVLVTPLSPRGALLFTRLVTSQEIPAFVVIDRAIVRAL